MFYSCIYIHITYIVFLIVILYTWFCLLYFMYMLCCICFNCYVLYIIVLFYQIYIYILFIYIWFNIINIFKYIYTCGFIQHSLSGVLIYNGICVYSERMMHVDEFSKDFSPYPKRVSMIQWWWNVIMTKKKARCRVGIPFPEKWWKHGRILHMAVPYWMIKKWKTWENIFCWLRFNGFCFFWWNYGEWVMVGKYEGLPVYQGFFGGMTTAGCKLNCTML